MPRKIGRYEILGPLATGGMAEILLARLVGPSGFERPVVIKRIRPDLDHTELVSLFLEEARVAAKVRHGNVVTVEDLGTDDGAPYLVMEYLEGESLSNVTRRLMAREEKLSFGLDAYIVAEACAGLHAAHELRNSEGELYGLVHRDVSPQNIFVKYDGAVKVVDFGIASTAASTDDNTVRGKFGYMAPEQFRGEDVDRRTDIFALGIVLYELMTGHRLFKRFDQAKTMRAVLTDRIVPPRRVERAVPPELEAICMRALARPRDDRYSTAAEMRRELLVAMRELASAEPEAELATLMARSFPDRIGDKNVLLRSVREGSVVDRIPEGDVDVTVEIPGIDDELGPESAPRPAPVTSAPVERLVETTEKLVPALTPAPPTSTSAPVSAPPFESPPRPPRPSRARWLIPIVLLVIGAAVSVRIVRNSRTAALVNAQASPPPPTASSEPASASAEPATITSAPGVQSAATQAPSEVSASAVGPAAAHPSTPPATTRKARAPSTTTALAPAPPAPPPETAKPAAAPSASTRGYRRFQ